MVKIKNFDLFTNIIEYIVKNSLDSDEIQNTFIIDYKKFNIQLIITPKDIKKSEKYNITIKQKNDGSYFIENIIYNDQNKINDSFSKKDKEVINNYINKGNNLDERNKIEIKEKKNNVKYLYKKPLSQLEESKDNSNSSKKSKSTQKDNLKFGKKNEHIEIDSQKSKENNEKYLNPLIEEKNDNEIKPKGLYNFSLNNYMNSLLQCLFHIKELREYFIKKQNKFTDDQPVCKAFAEVMNGLKNCDNDYFTPKEFKKKMGKSNNLFLGCKAGDVKDCFIYLIDTFLTELNSDNNNYDGNSGTNNNDFTDKKKVFKEILNDINKENNIINKTFIGYYETLYKCSKYKKNKDIYSIQTESLLLFELEKIKKYFNTSNLSIELGFKYYYREQLNTEFYCSECQKTHKGNAYEKIYRPPKILLIILDRGHGKTFKGDVEINKYLDLKNIIDEDEFKYSSLYKLICVSTHKGKSSSSGQYTACCLADNNKYYYFNDTYVQEIDENNIINNEPYLLFYRQIDNEDINEIEKIRKEYKEIQINEQSKDEEDITSSNISQESKYYNKNQKDKVEPKENSNKNITQSLKSDKALYEQEESKVNSYLSKKSKSIQNKNLKFGKSIEPVENKNKKTKEIIEKYLNPLGSIVEKKYIKPKGLYNSGLNCYMNSLLQCLFYIKELRDYFIQNKNKFTNEQRVCKAFGEVMNELENSDDDYVEPKLFKKLMGNVNNLFKGCKAGDVKDLFFNLIDTFLTELSKENNYEGSENNDIDYSDKKQMLKETLKEIDKDNIINKIFIGYYETIYKCSKYNKNVDTYSFQTESFLLFELEKIKKYFNTSNLSIELGFKYYYREQLNTEFYCSECQKTHKGNAYEKIYRPPKILLIILDRGHGKTFKGDVEINKYLDLKNIIDEERFEYSSLYKLICISTHKGTSSSSGHYTACCLADNNKYYYFSDTYVHEIDENNLFNDEPYLLFYKQIDNEDKNEINKIRKETRIIQINKEIIQNNIKKLERRIVYQKIKQNNNLNISNKNESKKDNNNNNIGIFKVVNTNEKEKSLKLINDNNLYSTKKNFSKYNNTNKIDYEGIQSALKQFIRNSNNYYEVNYYYPKNNYPYTWKLKIIGQKNTPYYGKILNFKLDFNKSFKYITDNITLEDKIYHLNFGEKGLLLFDIEYKDNKSFYDNLKELFNLLCNLFIEPDCELSIKY